MIAACDCCLLLLSRVVRMVNDVAPRAQWRGRWQMARRGGPLKYSSVLLLYSTFLFLHCTVGTNVDTEFDDVVF